MGVWTPIKNLFVFVFSFHDSLKPQHVIEYHKISTFIWHLLLFNRGFLFLLFDNLPAYNAKSTPFIFPIFFAYISFFIPSSLIQFCNQPQLFVLYLFCTALFRLVIFAILADIFLFKSFRTWQILNFPLELYNVARKSMGCHQCALDMALIFRTFLVLF